MKIAAVCGSGLGSSFMVEMNIKTVLKELGLETVEVNHYDLGSTTPDLADSAGHLGNVVVLNSIIDMDELKEKVTKACQNFGIL